MNSDTQVVMTIVTSVKVRKETEMSTAEASGQGFEPSASDCLPLWSCHDYIHVHWM